MADEFDQARQPASLVPDPIAYLRQFIPPVRRPQSMPRDVPMNGATNWPEEMG